MRRQGKAHVDRPFQAGHWLRDLDKQMGVELLGSLCQENLPVAELGRHLVLADSLRVGDIHFHP